MAQIWRSANIFNNGTLVPTKFDYYEFGSNYDIAGVVQNDGVFAKGQKYIHGCNSPEE